tara:strand:+ start:435 stop:614 length:180 start_codon:yes stop_codon:yes gene_type:complete
MSETIYYVGLSETQWYVILDYLRTNSQHPFEDVAIVYKNLLECIEEQICTEEDDILGGR